jgi:SNF2 family DNA or RNA helicase
MTDQNLRKEKALEKLKNYSGVNPYLLTLKKNMFVLNKKEMMSDFNTEYILNNCDLTPRAINKVVKIENWYAKKRVDDGKWNSSFVPERIQIISYLGETSSHYHCYIKYKQNMEKPISEFIPKKAVYEDFLSEDYHNLKIDFDRYDRLSALYRPDKQRFILPHQKEAVQFLLSKKKCILADDMGLGKLQDLDTPTPTPNGMKRFGDLKVGDQVFGSNGKPCTILQVFPHKQKDIYEIEFTDGSKTNCGLEHLWIVQTVDGAYRREDWKVMSLEEMLNMGLEYNSKYPFHRYKFRIPITEPVEYKEKEYFIHPYLMGMLLGDGNLCNQGVRVSIPDTEIESVDRLKELLNENYRFSIHKGTCPQYTIVGKEKITINEYNREIKRLGLFVHGGEKFIPQEYLFGSIEQRKELLMGLMDSDGHISKKKNKISYSTISKQLSEDVCFLVQSLGGLATIHEYDRTNEGKSVEYNVSIQLRFCPFKLKRKAERYTIDDKHRKYLIKSVKSAKVIKKADAMCIKVDSKDESYLTNNYIVTHNTAALSISAIEGNFDAVLIICPASLKSNWLEELTYYVPQKDVTIIGGFQGFKKEDLERYLGYGVGKSGKTVAQLQEEAKSLGKWRDNRFVIINNDILKDVYEMPASRKKVDIQHANENRPMLDYIKNKKSLIIIDEAHAFSNSKSQQYTIVKSLIKNGNPDSIYLSTGTPMKNGPKNYFAMLSLINAPITENWDYYATRYCNAFKVPINDQERAKKVQISSDFIRSHGKSSWYDLTSSEKAELEDKINRNVRRRLVASGASNLDELSERTSSLYLRRMKSELENALPPKTYHERIFDLTPQQQEEYSKLWAEYEEEKKAEMEKLKEEHKDDPNFNPELNLNKDLVEGGIYRRYLSNQMVEHTIELSDRCIAKNEKVVIATCYDEELNSLRDYYGDKCVVYNGKMSLPQKDEAKAKFMTDPTCMVFIGNIEAAGVGITLIASRVLIFNNISWVPGDNNQMCDRVYRLGQTRDVHIYYQFFRGTQYEKMWETVGRKTMVINQVIKKESDKES